MGDGKKAIWKGCRGQRRKSYCRSIWTLIGRKSSTAKAVRANFEFFDHEFYIFISIPSYHPISYLYLQTLPPSPQSPWHHVPVNLRKPVPLQEEKHSPWFLLVPQKCLVHYSVVLELRQQQLPPPNEQRATWVPFVLGRHLLLRFILQNCL